MIDQVISIASIERHAARAMSALECPYPAGTRARAFWMAAFFEKGIRRIFPPTVRVSQNDTDKS